MPLDLVLDDCRRLRSHMCVASFFLSYVFCVIHALIICVICRQFKRPQNLTVLFFGTDKRLFCDTTQNRTSLWLVFFEMFICHCVRCKRTMKFVLLNYCVLVFIGRSLRIHRVPKKKRHSVIWRWAGDS